MGFYYLLIGFIWCLYAGYQQNKKHGNDWKLPVTLTVNFFGWPVCMYLAYRKKYGTTE